MRRLARVTVVVALTATIALGARAAAAQCEPPPGNAFAFLSLADRRCPATPLVRWAVPEVTYDCRFFADGAHEVDCGAASAADCAARCREAAAMWNADLAGRFRFVEPDAGNPVTFCDSADGRTSIGAASEFCGGSSFGSNIIAVTLRVTITSGPHAGEQQDADIVLNSAFGDVFTPGLFRSVIGHELGHVLGLDHPDQCGRDANVLMRSALRFAEGDPCFVSGPTADDLNGAMLIYPAAVAPVCGDADADGTVTIADVASVLEAAIGLRGVCDANAARCDTDAADGIDVIDAANVQRRVAGLPSANACAL